MALMVIPNVGKLLWLEIAVRHNAGGIEDFRIALYQNNYVPVDASLFADFTPASFTGSGFLTLTRTTFNTPVIVANVAEITYPVAPIWTCSGGGPQIVYGWYMYGATSSAVYAAATLNSPRTMTTGTQLSLDPFTIKLKTFV